jgi:hypothetical protein
MIVVAARAAAILYRVLASRRDPRPILLPANVCVDVPLTVRHAGPTLELVDIEVPALIIDRAECLRRVRAAPERYAGLVFVHPYGADFDPEPFFGELRRASPKLLLIDDRCLCPPDPEASRVAPNADLTLWSTGRRKYLDLGGGGFARLAGSCPYVAQHARFDPQAWLEVAAAARAAVAGRRRFEVTDRDWLDLGPAPCSWQEYRARILEALPRAVERRRLLNAVYAEHIAQEVQLPPAFQQWRFNVVVPEPERLLRSFAEAGLFAGRHYASLGGVFGPEVCRRAEELHASIVNLFNDEHFDEARAREAARLVGDHLRNAT